MFAYYDWFEVDVWQVYVECFCALCMRCVLCLGVFLLAQ